MFGSENIFFAPLKIMTSAFLGAFLRAWSAGHKK
jgi:hypothetical protein